MMFDVDSMILSHSQQVSMISINAKHANDDLEFKGFVTTNLQLSYILIRSSPRLSSIFNSMSVTSSLKVSVMNSLKFVIFLDLNRSLYSSQNLKLDI